MAQEPCNGFMTLWKPLKTSHHPANFGDHKLCDSGDVMVLVCNAFFKYYAIQGSCDFIHYPIHFDDHGPCGSGDMMVFICQVISEDHMVKD